MKAGSRTVQVVFRTHYRVECLSHVVCVTGSSLYLGRWCPNRALQLQNVVPTDWWSGQLDIPPGQSFSWKLVVIDKVTGHLIRWEERENRILNIYPGNVMFHVFAYWNHHELFANVYGDCAESWAGPDVRHRYTRRPDVAMGTKESDANTPLTEFDDFVTEKILVESRLNLIS